MITVFSFLCVPLVAFSEEPLRADDVISVASGKIPQSGVLSDSGGMIFLEFSGNTRVIHSEDRTLFDGEVLPPTVIALPNDKPRARMREILTFELLGDTSDELTFANQMDFMRNLTRLRYQLLNPIAPDKTSLVKVFVPIHEPVGRLALWKYKGEEEGWQRVGGKTEETEDLQVQLFSSSVPSTGIYSVLDEDPAPDFVPTFPLDKIELAEVDPFAATTEVGTEGTLPLPTNEATPPPVPTGEVAPSLPGNETNIPPVEVEGAAPTLPQDIAVPVVIPGNGLEEPQSPAPDSILPASGPEGEVESPRFPFMILFAFVILGASVFVAFFGKKKS